MSAPAIRDARADELAVLAVWLRTAARPPAQDERLLLAHEGAAVLAGLRVVRSLPLLPLRRWLHLGWRVRVAPELQLQRRDGVLQLGQDLVGAAELAGFAHAPGLAPGAVRACAQSLLEAALAWLRSGPAPDPARIVAGVAGARDAQGGSPFWRGLGARLCGGAASQQALERWPRQEIEVALLEPATRSAIGAVDPAAEPWRAALHAAGLRAGQHIDPLDGGPVYEAPFA